MRPPRSVAREISYASSARTRAGRAVIRSLENITGRLRLIHMARGYDLEVAQGRDFWEVMVERYGLALAVTRGSLDDIPRQGPLIVISNHPYGILDGLMLGHILSRTRGDFRILAHRVFRKAAELDRVILPISFDETPRGAGGQHRDPPPRARLSRQRRLHRHLPRRHRLDRAQAVRPADGPVLAPLHRAADRQVGRRPWCRSSSRATTAGCSSSRATCTTTLRMALLVNEFKVRVGEPVRVVIGRPLDPGGLAARAGDARGMMDYLRAATYRLSPTPIPDLGYGFEFEDVR